MIWSKEKCKEVALLCLTKTEFRNNYASAYRISQKNKWLNEMYEHMITPNQYWTKDKCKEVALSCKTKREFSLKKWTAYNISDKNKWLNDICYHMKNKPKNYWTKDKCKEVALLCDTKIKFNKTYPSAYEKCVNNKWINEICKHMLINVKMIRNEYGLVIPYWTKERCLEVAKNCQTKKEFRQKYSSAYASSFENKWLDEICIHMKLCGNLYKRLIYLCEFSDNYVYVGLTYNLDIRKKSHLTTKCTVYNHILKTGLIPKFTSLTNFLNIKDAVKMEKYYTEYYKELGYNILNKTKTGSLGYYSNNVIKSKWNYVTCKE